MAKEILYNDEARQKIQSGVNKVANAVKITLGAKGRNVMFSNDFRTLSPTVTNDGVTIAKKIELKDPFENLGAQLIKDVAQKTNETSGDGTTTATILAQAIINEGMKNIAAGANPIELKKGIESAVAHVVKCLKEMAKPVVGKDDIEKVATVSANDPEIGKMIAEVFDIIGKEGIISVEEANTIGLSKEIVEGINFPKGCLSPYLYTDIEAMKCVVENPSVIVTDKKISSSNDIIPILQLLVQNNKKDLLIVADGIGNNALNAIIPNKLKGTINICLVEAPGFGDNRKDMLQDIAIMTGATLITSETGIELENFTLDMLGSAHRVVQSNMQTTIIDGGGDKTKIQERVKQIKKLLSETQNSDQKILLADRLSKVAGGVGVIRVGALSEVELKERKYRIEDAVEATKAAIDEGIIPGGGIALLNCELATQKTDGSVISDDQAIGSDIVKRAISYPIKQIAKNAGENGDVVIKEIRTANPKYKTIGWDCKNDKYGDMFEMGIIDPVKVTRCAIENASSVAAQVLTTEVLIVDEVRDAK